MSEDAVTTLEAVDVQGIMELLPHRYPFLLIDRIVDIDGDDSAVGIKNVTINEHVFAGHFPGNPIFPGVLLIEGMAQTAGAICVKKQQMGGPPPVVYFMTIDRAKFRKPVVPGDTVEFHVKKIRNKGSIWKFSAEAKVGGQKVAEAEISAMLVSQDKAK